MGLRLLVHGFAVLLLVSTTGALVFQSTTISLPRLFAERMAENGIAALVGFWSFAVLVLTTGGQLASGAWIDRGGSLRRALMVVVGLQAPLLLVAWGDGGLLLVGATLAMFMVFGQVLLNDALVARISRSRAYALKYVVSFSAGAFSA